MKLKCYELSQMLDGDILIERLGILLRIKHITFMEGYEKMWKVMEVLR